MKRDYPVAPTDEQFELCRRVAGGWLRSGGLPADLRKLDIRNLEPAKARELFDDLHAVAKRTLNEIKDDTQEARAKEIDSAFDVMSAVLDELSDRGNPDPRRPKGADTPADSGERGWRGANGEQVRIMRTAAEFRDYYAQRASALGDYSREPFGLDDFLRGVAGMKAPEVVTRALSIGTDSAGGYAVPVVLMPGIMSALVPSSSLLSAGAGVVPVDNGGKTYTTAIMDAIPTAAWRSESAMISESDPSLRSVVATPRSLSFLFKVSRELLADAQNLEAALQTAIAQAFAKELDRAGLRGSGTAPEPRGVLNTTGIQSVTNGANGASLATTVYDNLFSAIQAIIEANAPMPTAAIMAPRSLVTLAKAEDTDTNPLTVPPLVRDLRQIATSQIPINLTVGTSTDCSEIYVGDFRNVTFLMREQIAVQLLRERYADTGQLGFVCHVRADVVIPYPAALAVVTGVKA